MKNMLLRETPHQLRQRLPRVLLLLLTLWLPRLLAAQTAAQYTFTPSTGATLENMSTGTTALVSAPSDDGRSTLTAIGFSFTYAGTAYTQFSANVNGLLRLGATRVSTDWDNGSYGLGNATNTPKLMPLFDDLHAGTSAGGGKVHYKLVGSAPNRKLVIEWFVTVPYNSGAAANSRFQVWLNETSNTFDFVYGAVGVNTDNGGASVGHATSATVYESVTTSTNTMSTTATNNTNTTAIAAGTRYSFAPPPACSGVPTGGTAVATPAGVCPGSSTLLSLTGATVALGITYQWQRSTTSASSGFSDITGATSSTYTASPTQTTYYRALLICGSSGGEALSSVVTVALNPPTYASIPYAQDFESTWLSTCGTRDVPSNSFRNTPVSGDNSWRREDDGSSAGWSSTIAGYTPTGSSANGGTSSHSARFHSYDASSGTQGVLDLYANLTGTGTPTLTFDYINTDGSDQIEVLLSTNGGTAFGAVLFTQVTAGSWTRYSVPLPGGTATSVVRLRATSDYGLTDLGIDNVTLSLVSCSPPTALAASNITTTSAQVSFTPPSGTPVDYTVTTTPATTQPNATTSPFTLTGLTPNTAYTVTLSTNCSTTSSSSASTALSFRTALAPVNNASPTCGLGIPVPDDTPGGIEVPITVSGTTGTLSTTLQLQRVDLIIDHTWDSDLEIYLVAPSGDVVELSTANGGSGDNYGNSASCPTAVTSFIIAPGTDITSGSAPFVGSYVPEQALTTVTGSANGTWKLRVIDTAAGDLGTIQYVKLTFGAPPTCFPPTALAASNITTTSAQVSFTPPSGTPVDYTVTTTPATTQPNATTSPFTLTGLTPNTAYTVTLTSNCSTTNSSSASAPLSFRTALSPINNASPTCGLGIPVPDATAAGIEVPITVSGTTGTLSTTLQLQRVDLIIDHTWDSDLEIYLVAPSGDVVELSTANGGSGDNYGNSASCPTAVTSFIIAPGTDITSGTAPFVGSYVPEQALTTVTGSANGTWKLRVIDTAAGDLGIIQYVKLTFSAPPVTDLTVPNGQSLTATGTYNNITVESGGTLTLTGATTVNGAATVQAGGTLYTACQPLGGPGSFTVQAGATLAVCAPAGIASSGSTGAVQVTGARSFSNDANYLYNGTAAQVTGSGLPATVRNLTLDNSTGLTLSQALSVRQVARLQSGNLATGGNTFTLLSVAGQGTALIDNTGGVVNGTGTMQRAIDVAGSVGYHHYSAPVSNTTLADLDGAGFTNTYNAAYNTATTAGRVTPFPTVYGYDETRVGSAFATDMTGFNQGWASPAGPAAAMPVGRGYTANMPNTALVDFVGTFNNANQNMTGLTRGTAADAGWHLLGNPYPSPLDWDNVPPVRMAGLDGAAYVFNSTGRYTGTYRVRQNGMGDSPLIDAGSGFFVRTQPGQTAALNLTNADRITTFGAQPAFGRGTVDQRPQLQLSIMGQDHADDTYVYFETGSTAGVDAYFDATKLANPSGLNLSSLSAGQRLAINGLPLLSGSQVLVPLSVGVPATGSYTFSVARLANFGTATVELLDTQTGSRTPCAVGSTLTVRLVAGLSTGRFVLAFDASMALGTNTGLAAQVLLFPNPAHESFTLSLPALAGSTSAQATLYNALGQEVLTRRLPLTATGATTTIGTSQLAAGVYVLRLTAGDHFITKRVVVE